MEGGNLLKVGFADVNLGIPGVTLMIIDGVGAPGVVVEDPGIVEVAAEKESSKFKFILFLLKVIFLIVSIFIGNQVMNFIYTIICMGKKGRTFQSNPQVLITRIILRESIRISNEFEVKQSSSFQ